jgi:hypothetical protein
VALLVGEELPPPGAVAEDALEEACARLTIDRKVIVRKLRTAVLTTTRTSLDKMAGLPSQEHTPPLNELVLGKGERLFLLTLELTVMIPRSVDSGGRQVNLWESN